MPADDGGASTDDPSLPSAPRDHRARWWTAVARAPLALHALALAVLLSGVAALVGTDASFSGDEGAAIIQAQHLAAGEGWLLPYPLARVDPSGEHVLVALSALGDDGYAPYAKHPTYAVVLAGADRVGGAAAMVAVSIVGAVLAALAAALLARRHRHALGAPALWIAGVATPLLFDSQAVLAHAPGAAAAGLATVALVSLRTPGRSRAAAAGLAAASVAAVGVLAALRTEGTIYAIALGAVGCAIGWRERRAVLGATGAVVGLVGVGVLVVDRMLLSGIIGSSAIAAVAPTAGEDELVAGRLRALVRTFLSPGSTWSSTSQLAVLALVGAALVGAAAVRSGRFSSSLWAASVALAGVGAIGVLAAPEPDLVEGLFTASPVLLAGLLVLDRPTLRAPTVAPLAATAALFTVGVLLTQYERGGAAEWGARFLAIELPLLAALATIGFDRVRPVVPAARRSATVAVLAAVALTSAVASTRALDHYKTNARDWVRVTSDAVAAVAPSPLDTGEDGPVVVTTWLSLGRMMWAAPELPAGLYVDAEDLPATLDDLAAAGVGEVVLALPGGRDELELVDSQVEVLEGFPAEDGPVWVVRLLP